MRQGDLERHGGDVGGSQSWGKVVQLPENMAAVWKSALWICRDHEVGVSVDRDVIRHDL